MKSEMQMSELFKMNNINIFSKRLEVVALCNIGISVEWQKLCELNEIAIQRLKLFVEAKSEWPYFWESIRLQQYLIVKLVKEYRSFC